MQNRKEKFGIGSAHTKMKINALKIQKVAPAAVTKIIIIIITPKRQKEETENPGS